MRRGSQETPYRYARRCSTLAPYPWAAAGSTAPANVSSEIQEARAALRFLKDVEQDVLVQAMREELSNSNLCYFQHCFATMWDDSHDESSESDLDVPGFPSQRVAETSDVTEGTSETQTAVPAETALTEQAVPEEEPAPEQPGRVDQGSLLLLCWTNSP